MGERKTEINFFEAGAGGINPKGAVSRSWSVSEACRVAIKVSQGKGEPRLQTLHAQPGQYLIATPAPSWSPLGMSDIEGAGLEPRPGHTASRGGEAGGGERRGHAPPGPGVGQRSSLANSTGGGDTERFSTRGRGTPGADQGGVFLLRVDLEGEVRSACTGRIENEKICRNSVLLSGLWRVAPTHKCSTTRDRPPDRWCVWKRSTPFSAGEARVTRSAIRPPPKEVSHARGRIPRGQERAAATPIEAITEGQTRLLCLGRPDTYPIGQRLDRGRWRAETATAAVRMERFRPGA